MTHLTRIAFVGNSLPRLCGIATFTTDLQQSIAAAATNVETAIVAMTDNGQTYDYPSVVRMQIKHDHLPNYTRAANALNAGQFDVVSLQHEFGIFGGEAGSHILELVTRLNAPIVSTFHTVLAAPTPTQRKVVDGIADASSKIIVMAEKGRELLRTVYRVPQDKIALIPHGVPDFPFIEPDEAKIKLGFGNRSVILTFGLLSPNKGIEIMIDAMPVILQRRPDAVYVVLGATHPNLVRDQGETYREGLVERVHRLGIENHVLFLDQFVNQETLLSFISMCDVYVTPYLNEAQMTSGTLAYSFGLGKAVVSTPYWHARELLADGRGILVPFGDAAVIGSEIAELLTDDARRYSMRERAYINSRSMTWEQTADRYLAELDNARRGHRLRVISRPAQIAPARASRTAPEMRIEHLLSICDDTGLFQHAVHSVPDRSHGYCVDDNARALLVACALNRLGEQRLSEALTSRFAAFVQHAWNPGTRRFRNFMSFDRRWLEDSGSEDSHGRTLWALGECARGDANASRREWAAALFIEALTIVVDFRSPRAWAFVLLGLDAYCSLSAEDISKSGEMSVPTFHQAALAAHVRQELVDKLTSILSVVETRDWVWFEEGLAYDNARLSQALIVSGNAIEAPTVVDAGLRSLRWLMTMQAAPTGLFRPIGTQSFGDRRKPPKAFDQQPLEATATISACLAAWRADGGAEWIAGAERAFAWFLGRNDLAQPLVDPETGSCHDGLHPDRLNQNRGGESVVSYLLGLADIRELARISGDHIKLKPLRALSA